VSKLGDFLKNNGLKVLGRAAKVGVGFAAGGPAGAIAAAAQALGLPDGSDEAAVLEAVKADPSSLAKLREVENANFTHLILRTEHLPETWLSLSQKTTPQRSFQLQLW